MLDEIHFILRLIWPTNSQKVPISPQLIEYPANGQHVNSQNTRKKKYKHEDANKTAGMEVTNRKKRASLD